MEYRVGKILRLDIYGLGILIEEGPDGEPKVFTFDKIKGYRGESLEELGNSGIKNGAIVKFTANPIGKIDFVRPLQFKEVN